MAIKKTNIPEIEEQEFLEIMASTSLQDRLAQKRLQKEKSNEDEFYESTVLPEVASQNSGNDETLPSRPTGKPSSGKQRKAGLQDYRQTFLSVPRITDRKTVFISNELRERIVAIVRRLGTEKSSVSGFLENLVIHHLEEYREEIENWKKL